MPFEELKAKQSVMWGNGPYERVSENLKIAHDHLFRAVPPQAGERWLDVATGTGEIARPAARAGAQVTGLDLAPGLIETARQRAGEDGVEVSFEVGDAEALQYEDGSFDTVTSTFGVMFAPDHAAVARELARVCRPGGRLALLTWDSERGVAEFFKIMAAYQPARPEGVGNPFAWGDQGYVTELLGNDFELRFERGDCPQPGSSSEEIWELFASSYGPTKTLIDGLDEEKRGTLHSEWLAYFDQYESGGEGSQPRPYLLVLGTRR